MKYFFLIVGLLMPAVAVLAEKPMVTLADRFSWDLLWAGSWEESKNLLNRGDIRLGLSPPGLFLRGQVLDKHTLNFELEQPWGNGISSASAGLYHKGTGSRLLYGVIDEWGLPARIRSPWIRSAPYTENHKPIMADLRTTTSTTKKDEAYLYLSSPRLELKRLEFFQNAALPLIAARGFGSAQIVADENLAPAFSGGLETFWRKDIELLLEGFYTGAELPARKSSSWFSNPPPLPVRDFRLGAAALMLNMPYCALSSDWAWSETFAWGGGVYGNAGIRLSPPLARNAAGKPGPWHLSLSADGISGRYVGRDGASPGDGFRTAGKIEWKGPRSSLFRVNTSLRGPALDESFNRSSSGIYYRFPAPSASAKNNAIHGAFPLRVTRVSLNADRNGSDWNKIHDSVDGTLGLSLNLPPMLLAPGLLPATARKVKNPKPKNYPLGINLSASVKELGSAGEAPAPYPFFPANQEFDSARASGELLWSPGIFQFRTRWGYTAYAKKDNQWDGSISAAARFKYGRFSAKLAWPVFPEKWNVTLSWRVEKK
ncbi:MAG: hypothetical protein LBG95_09875 [Treponema sp.]|jgi:hypothetical protein|nr:hypothetical protein [Treponema sp.]